MQVIPELNSGGVERGSVDVANFIADSGYGSIIVSSGGNLISCLNKKVKFIKLDVKTKNPFKIFFNIKKIRKIIIENQVDVIHVRSRAPAWSSYFAINHTGCRLISTFHGTHSLKLLFPGKSFLKRIYNEIMLKGSKVIAVSNFIKEYIRENYPKKFDNSKIEVIHRGVDLRVFDDEMVSKEIKINLIKQWQIPDDKKVIMLPGRITFWKGHEFLIDSLKLLKRNDYLCLFVGSFDYKTGYKSRLEKKIEESGLCANIKFVGICNNMPVAYSLCDAVISASIRPEAFGRIAIESQAMGRITIATNIGGSKETIINNKTGFLVDPFDTKSMANVIDKVLSMDDIQRQDISNNAKRNVKRNFSNSLMLSKTLQIYKEIFDSY